MGRFFAGVGSALLLVAAGFFAWQSHAESEEIAPPAPAPTSYVAPLLQKDAGEMPAAPETSREEKRFARYDKDEDGTIARAEMMETRRKPFAKLDVNGDGRLSFEEWATATSERFSKADADRSGGLSAAEFRTTRRETKPRKCAC